MPATMSRPESWSNRGISVLKTKGGGGDEGTVSKRWSSIFSRGVYKELVKLSTRESNMLNI